MIFISHRGNLTGKNSKSENSLPYIKYAINLGFDVEIDVWYIDGDYWLGHDEPQYLTEESFLENEKLWCHSKNIEGLHKMLQNEKIHCFWHQEDACTLTSNGFVWTYPGQDIYEKSIYVDLCPPNYKNISCSGICSDYILAYKHVAQI
jgi:hypothetical protein